MSVSGVLQDPQAPEGKGRKTRGAPAGLSHSGLLVLDSWTPYFCSSVFVEFISLCISLVAANHMAEPIPVI